MHTKKYVAEGIGTFLLTAAVGLSLTAGLGLSTAVIAGLTLGLLVYTIGPISGAHVNPAVTLSLASIKKIGPKDTLWYLVAQVIGALIAAECVAYLAGSSPALTVSDTTLVGAGEALGAAILVWGIAAVAYKKTPADASGLTIGGSLLLGALVAGTVANGVINPAVAIGIGSVSAMYLVAPIVGGIVAAYVYRAVEKK